MAHTTPRYVLTAFWTVFWLVLGAPLAAQDTQTTPASPTDEADIEAETDSAGGNQVQEAQAHFFTADRFIKQAEKTAAKLAEAPPEKRAKLETQLKGAYDKAEQELLTAIQLYKKHPKAYAALGDVWRHTGRVERSVQAYDAALAVSADDVAALAGRAEAYLALGKLPHAKGDYDNVAALDKKRAAELRAAMQAWLATRQQNPEGIAPEALADFATWLAGIAKGTP